MARFKPRFDEDGMMLDDPVFDAMLDEYQEREEEFAHERAEMADVAALRPNAKPEEVRYDALRVGDFITAEPHLGEHARWVEVVERKPCQCMDHIGITFSTPQPLGVGLTDRWVIDRPVDEYVVRDGSVEL